MFGLRARYARHHIKIAAFLSTKSEASGLSEMVKNARIVDKTEWETIESDKTLARHVALYLHTDSWEDLEHVDKDSHYEKSLERLAALESITKESVPNSHVFRLHLEYSPLSKPGRPAEGLGSVYISMRTLMSDSPKRLPKLLFSSLLEAMRILEFFGTLLYCLEDESEGKHKEDQVPRYSIGIDPKTKRTVYKSFDPKTKKHVVSPLRIVDHTTSNTGGIYPNITVSLDGKKFSLANHAFLDRSMFDIRDAGDKFRDTFFFTSVMKVKGDTRAAPKRHSKAPE